MTARAARVRQLELGPFVRMPARRGLTVSQSRGCCVFTGQADGRERNTIDIRSQLSPTPDPLPRETDPALRKRTWLNRALEASLVPERHRIA
jgi:hypothetical protein